MALTNCGPWDARRQADAANDQSFPILAFSSRHDLGGAALEDRASGL